MNKEQLSKLDRLVDSFKSLHSDLASLQKDIASLTGMKVRFKDEVGDIKNYWVKEFWQDNRKKTLTINYLLVHPGEDGDYLVAVIGCSRPIPVRHLNLIIDGSDILSLFNIQRYNIKETT